MEVTQSQEWPAARTELRALASLTPDARNSRTHPADQIEDLATLMLEFGWTQPVLVDETGGILAGHGRVMAAEVNVKRGHRRFEQAPVIVAAGWSEAQKRAYIIADNAISQRAGWNPGLLSEELKGLSAAGFDMRLVGFTKGDLQKAMRGPGGGLTDPDAAPALEPVVVSRLGDVWLLGEHRIRCGDSTSAADVADLLDGQVPLLMVTDPPYGVSYDPSWRAQATGQKVRATGLVLNDDRADWREAWALFPGDVCYVWHGALHAGTVQASLLATGFEVRSQIIWEKDRFALSRGHFHWQHEPAWYAVRKGRKAHWRGGRKRSTTWTIKEPGHPDAVAILELLDDVGAESTRWEIPMTVDDGSTGHGTQKPVECMRRPMELNSEEGGLVYEPFSGSGTTLIAGEMSGRRVLAMELSPAYVDVAVRRWQAFTGRPAVLQSNGRTFEEVALERAPAAEADDGEAWA